MKQLEMAEPCSSVHQFAKHLGVAQESMYRWKVLAFDLATLCRSIEGRRS